MNIVAVGTREIDIKDSFLSCCQIEKLAKEYRKKFSVEFMDKSNKKKSENSYDVLSFYKDIAEKVIRQNNTSVTVNFMGISFNRSKTAGTLEYTRDKVTVYYNNDPSEPVVKKIYTIMHEVGHYILHIYPIKAFIDRFVYRDEDSIRIHLSNSRDVKEQQANLFAINFLAPIEEIIRFFEKELTNRNAITIQNNVEEIIVKLKDRLAEELDTHGLVIKIQLQKHISELREYLV